MIDCLELNVDNETVERNLGKYFYNLKKGKASNRGCVIDQVTTGGLELYPFGKLWTTM